MLPNPDDTVVALATAPGPGARAVGRLSGPAAFHAATRQFETSLPVDAPRRRAVPGRVRLSGHRVGLPGELYLWPAPRTYTGQNVAELHTLSCPPLVDRLVG